MTKDIKINYDKTFATKYTRDYYRGKSFHYCGNWTSGIHYINDEFHQDFVVVDNALIACTKSHTSTGAEPDGIRRDMYGHIIAIESEYWEMVLTVAYAFEGYIDNRIVHELWNRETTPEEISKKLIMSQYGTTKEFEKDRAILANLVTEDGRIRILIDDIEQDLLNNINSKYVELKATDEEISSTVASNKQELDDTIARNYTIMCQRDDMVAAKASRDLNDSETRLNASIELTADSIRSEVSSETERLDGRVDSAFSTIEQTASDITAVVEANKQETDETISDLDTTLSTRININAQAITSEAQARTQSESEIVSDYNTKCTQNAQAIASEASAREAAINNTQADYNSKFEQTARSISAEVAAREEAIGAIVNDYTAKIEINTNAIASEITARTTADSEIVGDYTSKITQTANAITSEVAARQDAIDNVIADYDSKFEITAQNITAEVEAREAAITSVENDYNAKIEVNAQAIASEVSARESSEEQIVSDYTSRITQTADELASEVSAREAAEEEIISDYTSKFSQTAEAIQTEITNRTQSEADIIEDYESKITQTADELSAEISSTATDLEGQINTAKAEIKVTTDQISATVTANKEDADDQISSLSSTLMQTASQIRSEVAASVEDLEDEITDTNTALTQTAAAIRGEVSTAITNTTTDITNAYTAAIQASADEITTSVQETTDALGTRLTTAESNIAQNANSITLTVESLEDEVSARQALAANTARQLATQQGIIDSLQEQIDGTIDTWFYEGTPTLNNAPASSWTTDELKRLHIGDLYYDKSTGNAYRFVHDGALSTYSWVRIPDNEIATALKMAADAQETADGKMTIFYSQPSTYRVGDLWIMEVTHSGDADGRKDCIIKRSTVDRDNNYVDADWVLVSDIANATKVKAAFSILADMIDSQVAEYTSNNELVPGSLYSHILQSRERISLTIGQAKSEAITNATGQVNDLKSDLLDTGIDITHNQIEMTADNIILKNNSGTRALTITNGADNKPVIDASSLNVSGIFTTSAWTDTRSGVLTTAQGYANTAESNAISTAAADATTKASNAQANAEANAATDATNKANTAKSDAISAAAEDATSKANAAKNAAIAVANAAQSAADAAQDAADAAQSDADAANALLTERAYLTNALKNDTAIAGGLILSTLMQLGGKVNGTWTVFSGINGGYESESSIAAWYGGDMVDKALYPSVARAAKTLFRMDGSGYLADNNISWDAAGNATFTGAIHATSLDLGAVKVAASSVSGLAPVATSGNASDINGLGSLATKNTVSATGGDITGLGSLATKNKVSATTEVTGLASVATGGNLDYSKVSGLGALATEDSVNYSDLTGKPDLSVYATNSALSNYVLATTLSQTLTSYTTNSALATTLSDYLTITSAESTYVKPAALAGYVQTNVGIGTPDAGTSYFMVSNQGLLTAENAVIKGTVFAGSGAIGGITIGNNGISSTNGNFSVNSSGHIYANDITLANGSVGSTGTFTFGTDANRNSYLKSGMTSLNDTTHNGIYVGTDGIALGKGVFKVLANGSITATTLTVGAGQISGTLAEGNIPSLSQSKITGLTNDLADIEDIAEGAASDASSAVTTANSAASTASSAASTASTAATNASTALTKANTAISDASSAVTTANTASTNASNAVTTANSAASTASAAATAVTNSRDAIAYHFGYADYDTMVAAARAGGATFVQGGYLNTNLIQSDAVVTNYLSAHKITANQIDTASLTINSGQVTGLGSLATKSSVGSTDLDSTIISGGYIKTSLINASTLIIGSSQVTGLGSLATKSSVSASTDITGLANVATSGDYADLDPTTIPDLSVYLRSDDGTIVKVNTEIKDTTTGTSFEVGSDGLLTAHNAIIYGTIYASTGQIGNWALSQGKLSSGSGNTYTAIDTNPNNSHVIWAGAENPGNAVFSVGRSGAIKATSGLIGPFSIMPAKLIAIDDGMVLRRLLILEPGYVSQTVARTASSTSFLGVAYGLDEASVSVNSQAAMYIKNNRPSDVAGANKDNIGVDIGVTAANMNNTGLSIKTSYGVTNTCIDATLTSSSTYDTTSSACAKFLIQGDGYEKTGILVTAKGSGTKYGVDVSITSGNGAKTAYRATVAGTATTDTCYGFYADVSGSGAKYAFYANNGVFGGLRPNTKVITSSSVTLSASDFTIINTYSSGDTTLSIPSDCEKVGQTYLVLNTVQKRITIKPRSGATIKCNGYTYTYSSPMVTGSEELMILLVCTGPGAWYATYHYEDD